jgi:hypothetical protein
MDPINYNSAFANVQSPVQAFTQGLQGGVAFSQVQAEQAAQQAALAQKQQMQADLSALSANPTPQAIAQASLKYPQLSEQFKRSFDALSSVQQQAKLDAAGPVHAAVLAGQYGVAAKQLRQQADAQQNSGNEQEAQQTRAMADLIEQHPETAKITTGLLLSSALGPERYTKAFGDLGAEQRAADLAPGAVRKAKADADGEEAKAATAKLGIVAQKAGALAQAKDVKPTQAETMFRTLAAQGTIPKADLQGYLDGIPADPKAVPDYLRQVQASGLTAEQQTKYTTPTADAALSAKTQVQTTGMNNRTQLAVQDRIDARSKAESEGSDDAASFTPEAIDNAAARYNIDGTLPPMGMGKSAAAGRTKILNRAAELKAGISGEQQRRDQLNNKADIANKNRAISAFNQGKQGNAIRSFNVLLTHLDTLDSLSDALDNGNVQAINRLGNAYAKATGKAAPTNFEAVKHIVGDEAVKAVVGGAGALGDREAIAKTIDGANSPAQLKGVIKNFKELAVGQLGGLEQQYRTSTGLNDFEHLLSPAARLMRAQHGGGTGAGGGGKVVDFGSLK